MKKKKKKAFYGYCIKGHLSSKQIRAYCPKQLIVANENECDTTTQKKPLCCAFMDEETSLMYNEQMVIFEKEKRKLMNKT